MYKLFCRHSGATPGAMASEGAPKKPLVITIEGLIGAGKTTLIEKLSAALTRCNLRVQIVKEPVDKWRKVGILQEFYTPHEEPLESYVTYAFQSFTYVTRLQEMYTLVEAFEGGDIPDVILMERTPWTDVIFMELQRDNVGTNLMEMYETWWKLWSRIMPFVPEKAIYLKPSVEECMRRIKVRARKEELRASDGVGEQPNGHADKQPNGVGEQPNGHADNQPKAKTGISMEYLEDLHCAHEAFLQNMHGDRYKNLPERPFDEIIVVPENLADADFSVDGDASDRLMQFLLQKIGL